MDRDDYLQFQSDADRLGTDAQCLQRFYAVAAAWNIPREEAEALLRDWQGPKRTVFRASNKTQSALVRGLLADWSTLRDLWGGIVVTQEVARAPTLSPGIPNADGPNREKCPRTRSVRSEVAHPHQRTFDIMA
jgi:hypothetical protein